MRKIGLIAAIAGFGVLGLDLLLRGLINLSPWAWIPGAVLLSGGSALFLWSRWSSAASVAPAPKMSNPPGTDTARLLDNFEQRFAELKGRKASSTVLGDLYALGTQLEQRGRTVQATAVYRHLARIDNTYRDVAAAVEASDGCRTRQIEGRDPGGGAAPAGAPRRARAGARGTTQRVRACGGERPTGGGQGRAGGSRRRRQ